MGVGQWALLTAACVSDCRGGRVVPGAPMQLTTSGGGARQRGLVAKEVSLT